MSTKTVSLEILPDETQLVVSQNSLAPETAQSLKSSFAPSFAAVQEVLAQSKGIVVTDASQKLNIKIAYECRQALVKIRTGADKIRKGLKDEAVRTNRAIDGFYNILVHLTASEEARLKEQEDFVARQEAARKAVLKAERETVLAGLQVDPALYQLGEMTEDTFNTLVEGTKLARAAQAEAVRKAEAERIEREAAELAERARIKAENERLKAEAEKNAEALRIEREAAARAAKEAAEAAARAAKEAAEAARAEKLRLQALAEVERQKQETARKAAEAELKRQRDARIKAEAEVAAAKQAEEARLAAEYRAKAKAEQAPDLEKVRVVLRSLREFPLPSASTPSFRMLVSDLRETLDAIANAVEEQANKL